MAVVRLGILAAVAACAAALPARADVGATDAPPAPWTVAARTLMLAPGDLEAEARDRAFARAFSAAAWHRDGVGIEVDGEWRRAASLADGLADIGLGARAFAAGPLRLDVLAGARVDASLARDAQLPAWSAATVPMAGARAALDIAENASVTLRASAAPDAQLGAWWRVSAGLRIDLARDCALTLDARWASAPPFPEQGSAFADAVGRASAWLGLSIPF